MTREELLNEVDLYAERLVAAGDLDDMEAAFNSRDPDFDVNTLSDEALLEIYQEFIEED